MVPRDIAPRYIATLAYRHEIVKNGFPPMLIPPLAIMPPRLSPSCNGFEKHLVQLYEVVPR